MQVFRPRGVRTRALKRVPCDERHPPRIVADIDVSARGGKAGTGEFRRHLGLAVALQADFGAQLPVVRQRGRGQSLQRILQEAVFGAKHGFLKDALKGLASTALSDYRQLRTKVGLQRYSEAEMTAKLAGAGFSASRAHVNIGHNPWRMTFVARHAF